MSFIKRFISNGAKDWQISEAKLKLMLSVPFLVMFSGVVAALMGKPAYKDFTGEDGIAENLQVMCYAISLIFTVGIVRYSKLHRNKFVSTCYMLLAIGLIFMIGEELSWGQRWFGWGTPEEWAEINKQKETNLHNIYGVGDTFKWLHLLGAAYGAFMPILLMRWHRLAPYREKLVMIVPHFTLTIFFLPPFFWRVYRNFFEEPAAISFAVTEYSEVMELVLTSGLVFFLLYQKRRLQSMNLKARLASG